MVWSQRRPTPVLHRHARAFARRLEQHFEFGALIRTEVRVSPIDHEARGRVPHRHTAGFVYACARFGFKRFEQPAADARFKVQRAGMSSGQPVFEAAPPPQVSLSREDIESISWSDGNKD